jgi:predicted membrane protein
VLKDDFAHRRRTSLVFGLFVIVVGVFALLDNLDLFDSRLIQPFWPLGLVVLGALKLASWRRPGGVVFGIGFIGVGVAMTLNNLGLLHFHVRDWWPALLILAGVSVVTRGMRPESALRRRRRWSERRDERTEHGARIDASAVMSGLVLRNDSQEFQGGEISTVMGAVEVDLRQAAIVGEARLYLSVIMGGVEIKVPRDWSVSINGTPTLGGIEDKTVPPMTPGKRLVIAGSVVMGGVEISN